jgi:hypothetical protein
VKEFEQQAERAKDLRLKVWVGNTLPTPKDHPQEIETVSPWVLARK